MEISKTKLDKAGESLAKEKWKDDAEYIIFDDIVDEYRKLHLEPLTKVMLKLQEWLSEFERSYYIAQRLKRKPQIIRKLKRFSVRLSQLQDIGGCRIIFESNDDIDDFITLMSSKLIKGRYFSIERIVDYREKGRDDSGYRAVHIIAEKDKTKLEIQIRSRIQHYWAESIERTSVVYGYYLKELEGNEVVLDYFKVTSNIFHEIESKRRPTNEQIKELDELRTCSEKIIRDSDKRNIFDSFVNEAFIKAMISRESSLKGNFQNWMIVFNWNTGAFNYWEVIPRNSEAAIRKYADYEKKWKANEGYEVVMIGSSDVSTIRQTHSHYFGIETYDKILEDFGASVVGFSKRNIIDSDSRQILDKLHRHDNWGTNKCSLGTLKNHYCAGLLAFEESMDVLEKMGLVVSYGLKGPVSLNIKKKVEIESFI